MPGSSFCQPTSPEKRPAFPANYDETKVGTFTLPDPLTLQNGKKVTDTKTWIEKRRPEIIKLFEENQFGKAPAKPSSLAFDVFDKGTPVFDGKAIRKQVTIYFTKDTSNHKLDLLIYIPHKTSTPPPLLLTISFSANNLAVNDPGIKQGMIWRDGKKIPATASPFKQIDVQKFIDKGIAYATVYYGDIEPDFKTGINYGIRSIYLKQGAKQVAHDEWGAVAAWSWGLSRVMDYLETDKAIDAKHVAVTGASRLGKTVCGPVQEMLVLQWLLQVFPERVVLH